MRLLTELMLLEGSKAVALRLQQELVELLPNEFDVDIAKEELTATHIYYYLLVKRGNNWADVRWGDSSAATSSSIAFKLFMHRETVSSHSTLVGVNSLVSAIEEDMGED